MNATLLNSWKILSVGGSIIIPPTGFDTDFLKKFRDLILSQTKKGQKFILVIGGGGTARNYQAAAESVAGLSNDALDWVGIYTTQLNAQFVRMLFGADAHAEIISNPTKKMSTKKSIIIGAGWKPGQSTDAVAVALAKTFGAEEVINLSNIDYVYTADPKTNPNATKLENIGWKELRKIIGDTWTPGANVPFDPIAAKTAQKLKLKVSFVKGTDLVEVTKVVQGKKCLGTVII
jgi:uridylate kinase